MNCGCRQAKDNATGKCLIWIDDQTCLPVKTYSVLIYMNRVLGVMISEYFVSL